MVEIRELRADETPFVEEMLWTALAWRPGDEDGRMVLQLA